MAGRSQYLLYYYSTYLTTHIIFRIRSISVYFGAIAHLFTSGDSMLERDFHVVPAGEVSCHHVRLLTPCIIALGISNVRGFIVILFSN